MPITPELLQRCQQQDRKAQNELYKELYGVLMAVCLRYANNDEHEAQSLLNMGFVKVVLNLEKYDSNVPFLAWVRRLMINHAIDEFRKNKRMRLEVIHHDFAEQPNIAKDTSDSMAEADISAELLANLLTKIPQMSAKVFNLFAIDGYSHDEVANMLGITVSTSKWHVMNARQKLQELLKSTLEYPQPNKVRST